ncbi:toll/interleukin-1 receptor domain-containing protein [Rhizobium laguerreae]|uniref:toll/interleukin-1 receptor domain-containing protein n=1 Tax=Rhizobium laguerreae TaxID=1076926 RepID=UPI001C924FB4|nr:toll/interleukin-1 receptor domain-containing protein [Rhizobium laguerreae]MBY3219500.1 toll/interleukin-1 receptor domain-containing protein [Rhizobium laguerreae]MBY3335284.1 toll/interleukin-1 receptor domain-containing protein [Rhizobium laguerreae]
MSEVGVFISYNHKDKKIADAVVETLAALSQDLTVFIDHAGLEGGDEYEPKLSESIRRAQWFVIISSGLGNVERDMSWCFYEAGQFRAKLEAVNQLNAIRDRLCYFYDGKPPSQLRRYQGTRVSLTDRNDNQLNVTQETEDSLNYENTDLFDFLCLLLTKSTDQPVRNINDQSIRKLMRTGVRRITHAFFSNRGDYLTAEDVFQPRIKFTIPPPGSTGSPEGLSPNTKIDGEYNVLPDIFGISGSTTTWADIKSAACNLQCDEPMPLWVNDLEAASCEVARGKIPTQTAFVCVGLDKQFYRPVYARNLIYSSGKKDSYIAFIPSRDRRFDVNFRSSLLLSALILTIRFRQRVLPIVEEISENLAAPGKIKAELLLRLQTTIVIVEAEAREFGLMPPKDANDEPPLLNGFRDGAEKTALRVEIKKWLKTRALIFEKIAAAQAPGRDVTWSDAALEVSNAFSGMKEINSAFLQTLCNELLYIEKD